MTNSEPDLEAAATAGSPMVVDGRSRRRDLNRSAVVDALLGLYDAGRLEPSIAEIAGAAGLSARSVFRYFDDVDDLVRAAIEHQQHRLAPIIQLDVDLSGPLADRVASFVTHRLRLLDGMGQVGRVARMRADAQPLVAAELARLRREMRRQVSEVVASELAGLAPDDAAERLAAADVVCSFEAYRLMRHDQGLTREAAGRSMQTALIALFGSAV